MLPSAAVEALRRSVQPAKEPVRIHQTESAESLAAVRERRMTGREFLFKECDEKFWEEDLSDDGNAFAHAYYESKDDSWAYLTDYADLLADDVPSLYDVADTWENFDLLAPIIDRRHAEWKGRQA
jgi:hypothetical protein